MLNAWYWNIINRVIRTGEAYNVVRVCRNKHCCKRTKTDTFQTVNNLLNTGDGENDIIVEASGCLSQCDKGPNVEISTGSGTILLHGITDAQTCAFQLEEASASTPSFSANIPKILIAASKVIEQSQLFSMNGQLEEEIRFLTSVIDKLKLSPAVSASTSVGADAHALRAKARLELARKERAATANNSSNDDLVNELISTAIDDARSVVQDFSAVATPGSLSLAYRTWTDAELLLAKEEEERNRQQEIGLLEKRDISRVIAVLRDWYEAQPVYRTKLQTEIQTLLLNA